MRITAETLLRAYAVGVFPMGDKRGNPTIYWVHPEQRGILPLERFHLPRSLAKTVRRGGYDIRIDRDFAGVVRACAEPAPGREDTWINRPLERLYKDLFRLGHAHSVECWRGDSLVGGLYGVTLGGAFFGESMFSRARDASKVALAHLVARLAAGGFQLLDTQFHTAHLAQFGAVEISRNAYSRRLALALQVRGDFYSLSESAPPSAWLPLLASGSTTQSRTITS